MRETVDEHCEDIVAYCTDTSQVENAWILIKWGGSIWRSVLELSSLRKEEHRSHVPSTANRHHAWKRSDSTQGCTNTKTGG